ncbi:MAG: DNA mismatch repair endonuclease MutL [Clostridia bacterium]|nr:DNA mismatch repair endonuclease MutL [Clostridia bacterium]
MKKINVLDKNIYNRIAAGEVIDRPYSAVKELIENSLDAKATDIEIYIEQGGKQLIKVVDNGSGIEKEDLCDAFAPHATSKISAVEDLDFIQTLGFRGEALASISVISKTEIISVTQGNQAWKITCDGGNVGQIVPAALEKGTIINVRNLFYNTPVRAKFLKTDKKEEADITNFVSRYILGNPQVSFKYFIDGKLMLQSFGGGSDEAVAQVYGAKVLSECYKIDGSKDGFRVYGYIGNQNFFKPNKTYQSIFLNGRYIVNNTIATAINNAYASYMMKRQFPFYILNVEVPLDFVDVNVHPNKADVRFVDNRRVFSAVYSIISPVLDGTAKAADFVLEEKRLPEIKSTMHSVQNGDGIYVGQVQKKEIVNGIKDALLHEQKSYEITSINTEQNSSAVEYKNTSAEQKRFDPINDLAFTEYLPQNNANVMRVTDDKFLPSVEQFKEYAAEKKSREQQKIDYKSCKFKGNLFDTYLIYETIDRVFLIDQHAAHERLIYDKLCNALKSRTVLKQPMLVPYIFSTNPIETQFIDTNIKLLRSLGFGIEAFGLGSFRVDEVPVDLQDINIKGFFDEILSQIASLKTVCMQDVLKDKLATTACKHAVKGGMRLTEQEIDALFEMIGGDMGLKCPHGRPVCVSLTKKDIEKMFKRII